MSEQWAGPNLGLGPANDVRSSIAKARDCIRSAPTRGDAYDVVIAWLELRSPPPGIGRMKVETLLRTIPGYGKQTYDKLADHLVSWKPRTRVEDLQRQPVNREAIVMALRDRRWRLYGPPRSDEDGDSGLPEGEDRPDDDGDEPGDEHEPPLHAAPPAAE